MDEARRYLRYVKPGLIFVVETALLLLIFSPQWLQAKLADLAAKEGVGATTSTLGAVIAVVLAIGGAIGGVLVLGVFGFVLAVLHHACHWSRLMRWLDKGVLDHSQMVNRLVDNKLIPNPGQPKKPKIEQEEKPANVDRLTAEQIVLAEWYKRVKSSKIIGEAVDKKIATLCDTAHALGAARVAAFAAAILAPVLRCVLDAPPIENATWYKCVGMLVAGLLVTCLFHSAYKRVARITQGIFERILEETIERQKPHSNAPPAIPADGS